MTQELGNVSSEERFSGEGSSAVQASPSVIFINFIFLLITFLGCLSAQRVNLNVCVTRRVP